MVSMWCRVSAAHFCPSDTVQIKGKDSLQMVLAGVLLSVNGTDAADLSMQDV